MPQQLESPPLPGAGRSAIATPRTARPVLHVLSNLLLGVAIGLVAYYLVTDVVASAGQRALAAELRAVGMTATTPDASDEGTRTLDFAGWEEQDAAYWTGRQEGQPFGRLVIARMGLDTAVVTGARPEDLKKGPGWIGGTDVPGPTGNVAIAGHRTTYGSPFGRIDALEPGDTVAFYSPFRRYLYKVTRVFVVAPDAVEVIAHTDEPQLTLTACHPRYSARYRIIAQARLVDVRRLGNTGAGTGK